LFIYSNYHVFLYGSEYDESEYEDATDYFNDECDDFSQQNMESENGYGNLEYDDRDMDDAFLELQDMCFEEESVENECFDSSDGDYGPRFELDFGSDSDEEEVSASEDQSFNLTKSHGVKSSNSYEDFSEMCKKWQELLASCKSFSVPKRSVSRTRFKVSSKISKSTASALLVKAPISVPLVIAPISFLPASLEISVTLKIDCSAILSPPTDDESLHTTPGSFDLVTCLELSPIIINSLSAVDAEIKVERAMPELVVQVDACKKEEVPLDPIRAAQYSSLFSIIPIVQMFKRLFHTCTLYKFELGRDPPNVLDIGDSRFGFG
jgi:hypothetical protein